MPETYEKRLARLSRIQYLENNSDFARTSTIEFETWKGQIGLTQAEQTKWRGRRDFLEKYFRSILNLYTQEKLNHETMLQLFLSAATKKDQALLGHFVIEAFSSKPLPKKRSLNIPYLRSRAIFLKWFKKQSGTALKGTALQNQIKAELEDLIGSKISGSTLEEMLKPNVNKIE